MGIGARRMMRRMFEEVNELFLGRREAEAFEAVEARQRLNAGSIEEEEERLGKFEGIDWGKDPSFTVVPFKGKPLVFEERPGPSKVIMVTKLAGRGAVIPPRENVAHRERHGLDGAFDASCDDICCKASVCTCLWFNGQNPDCEIHS
jgi:hypothetical protein